MEGELGQKGSMQGGERVLHPVQAFSDGAETRGPTPAWDASAPEL